MMTLVIKFSDTMKVKKTKNKISLSLSLFILRPPIFFRATVRTRPYSGGSGLCSVVTLAIR